MPQEAEKPNPPGQPAEQGQKTARELYEQKIADNPKWCDTTTPGRGFIVGGVREADHPGAEKDPPYLADLLKYHPDLTREEALEMIKEAGG
jgi:hypothetical protein